MPAYVEDLENARLLEVVKDNDSNLNLVYENPRVVKVIIGREDGFSFKSPGDLIEIGVRKNSNFVLEGPCPLLQTNVRISSRPR